MLIDYLNNLRSYQNIGLAFIYFDYKGIQSHQIREVAAHLLCQLVLQLTQLDKALENAYDELYPERRLLTVQKILEHLASHTKLFNSTFIVLDAIDECGSEERIKILSAMEDLCSTSTSSCKLLVTSRPHIKPEITFQNCHNFEITANENDIKQFIRSQFDKIIIQPDEKKAIVEMLLKKSEGMFKSIYMYSLTSIGFSLLHSI